MSFNAKAEYAGMNAEMIVAARREAWECAMVRLKGLYDRVPKYSSVIEGAELIVCLGQTIRDLEQLEPQKTNDDDGPKSLESRIVALEAIIADNRLYAEQSAKLHDDHLARLDREIASLDRRVGHLEDLHCVGTEETTNDHVQYVKHGSGRDISAKDGLPCVEHTEIPAIYETDADHRRQHDWYPVLAGPHNSPVVKWETCKRCGITQKPSKGTHEYWLYNNADEQPITAEWLLSVGFKAAAYDFRSPRSSDENNIDVRVFKSSDGDWGCRGLDLGYIHTRRDVRLLCELLRIELKEGA